MIRQDIERLLSEIERRHAELSRQSEPEPRGGYADWAAGIGRICGQLSEMERMRDELYEILQRQDM